MPDTYTISLENIIYSSYVKLDRLERIVYDTFSNTSIASATNLNVFIDLYSVMKQIFSEHFRTEIKDQTGIISCIINMCGHYRSFFKRLGVHTTFYLIASSNTCEYNERFFAGYNATFKAKSEIKLFRQIADVNYELMKVLCPYLPDIHFIKSNKNYEVAVIIAYLIEMLNDGKPNLIISKDMYPVQLCTMYPYTSYLYPFKKKGEGDFSIMIPINEKPSFQYQFWKMISDWHKFDINHVLDIHPSNISLLWALNRFPPRDISTFQNIQTAKKIILDLSGNNGKVTPEMMQYDTKYNNIYFMTQSRYNALDVSFMLMYYKQDPESKQILLTNLRDDAKVNEINAKFLSENPIDLSRL